jgi:RNAse (barnase) inhibitor barstar
MNTIDLHGAIDSLIDGLALLSPDLGIVLNKEGFSVTVEQGDHLVVEVSQGKGRIEYSKKVEFYRGLCLLMQHIDGAECHIEEKAAFECNGIMLECSRNAVLDLHAVQFILRKMALMGLNLGMLYTEDTYYLENYPYFGYGRGRYPLQELEELDDYAYALGIELIPCIQTLSHLDTVLRWPSAAEVKDTDFTLLVDSEPTYTLIEDMLVAASAPYRSKRIHIGMDEAGDMGTGAYRERFGNVERKVLMARHLERVNAIVKKLGLVPMMWSDMHITNITRQPLLRGYYPMDVDEVPDDIVASVPVDVALVYWDYYHDSEEVYDKQIQLHKQFPAETIFAGGIWTWTGPSADYQKTIATTVPALAQCREHGIKQVFATAWGDDGGETNLLTILYGLQLFAELDYTGKYDPFELEQRFRQSVGVEAQAFLDLALFNNIPGTRFSFENANPSKMILYEDPLLPLFEQDFVGLDLKEHYAELADRFRMHRRENQQLEQLWDFYYKYALALTIKCEWRDSAAACIRDRDRDRAKRLVEIARENVHALRSLRKAWETMWFSTNKPFGFEVIDLRMGGIIARFQSAEKRMNAFATGVIDDIPELSCEKLPYARTSDGEIRYLNRWGKLVTPGRIQHSQ